jgi:hypothetical protein
MAGLQSLAVELLQEIISLVSGCKPTSERLTRTEAMALRDLRRICRFTNAVVEPMLFRHLVINLDLASGSSPVLQDLVEGSTNAIDYAKALTIRLHGEQSDESDDIASVMAELALALGSLHNVNTVW